MQDSPQIEPASLTHCESHLVLQQYESWLQMLVTQASQPDLSLVPAEHSACVHVPLPPPVHDWPHTEATSPTQIESHAVVQQYESAVQIDAAQLSQLPVRLAPVEQIG